MNQGLHKCHRGGNQRKHAHPINKAPACTTSASRQEEPIFPHTDQDQPGPHTAHRNKPRMGPICPQVGAIQHPTTADLPHISLNIASLVPAPE